MFRPYSPGGSVTAPVTVTRVSSGAARAAAIGAGPRRAGRLRRGCIGVTTAGRGTWEEAVGLPGRDLAVGRPRAAAIRAPAEAPVRAGAAVVGELVRRAPVGSDQGHAVAPVAERQAGLAADTAAGSSAARS